MSSCVLTQSLWLLSPSLVGYNCVCTYPPLIGHQGSEPTLNCTPGQFRPSREQNKRLFCAKAGECPTSPHPVWVGELTHTTWFTCSPPEDRALADVSPPLVLGFRVGPETDISPPPLFPISPWMSGCSRGRAVYWQCQLKWYHKKWQVDISILFKT